MEINGEVGLWNHVFFHEMVTGERWMGDGD